MIRVRVDVGVRVRVTVVPALGDPRRERPPDVYGHVINVPTHFNVLICPSDERPPAMYGHFCLVPRVPVHDRNLLGSVYGQCEFRVIIRVRAELELGLG